LPQKLKEAALPVKITTLSLLAAFSLMACASVPKGVSKHSDVRYGPHERNVMDVYTSGNTTRLAPVIFMVHGGAWIAGNKDSRRVVFNKLKHWLPQGYIFISSNYRLVPDANPLQQAQDIANAVAYAQKNAARWGGDPDKFILMGHSAGAHIISLIAASPEYARNAGMRPLRGSIALDSGGLDLVQIMQQDHYGFYDKAFGNDIEFWKKASPLYTLSSDAKPMLIVCSTQREDQPCDQAQKFAAKAAALHVDAQVLPQDLSHIEINADLGEPSTYTNAVDAFLQKILAH